MPISEVVNLADLVEYQPGQVVSRTLAQNSSVSITLFAFASGDALITIDTEAMTVSAGQSVVLPANVPHAVDAREKFKMVLVIVKPNND